MSAAESDRKNILRQMKVRTTYRTDKSWIQNAEDERDEIPSPISPQRKSLEGRNFLWSPTPDSKPDRNSGVFTANEVITSSSTSPPVQTSNKQFSYSSNETNRSPSTTSPPPSTTGSRTTPSYIIRGQPVNAVSQVKSPSSFNGFQKSYSTNVQPRTSNSLPRVPTVSGHKMSTEEYKKLAPYNVRNKSVDLSDDETPYTHQEQFIRTEQASSVLRNTSPKDRSYVLSAAKRNSGIGASETTSPFVATRVQIQDEATSPTKKSQTLPKTLSSYLYDDNKRSEDHWKETQPKQTTPPSRTTPSGTERSNSPKLTSYSTSNTVESNTSTIKPAAAKITVVTDERDSSEQPVSKPSAERDITTNTVTTRKERVETQKKGDALPESLASYLYDDVHRFEKNWKSGQPTQSTSQTVTTRVTDRPESPQLTSWSTNTESRTSAVKPEPGKITIIRGENEIPVSKPAPRTEVPTNTATTRTERVDTQKKSDALPESLASYLYDDVHRFEKSWKSGQPTQLTSQTVTTRVTDRPESPKLTSWSTNTESRTSAVKPEPGKITILKDESGTSDSNIPRLTSSHTEIRSSNVQGGPGKITVLREESPDPNQKSPQPSRRSTTRTTEIKDVPDSLKLTSSSLSTSVTETTEPRIQAGPGKVTVIRDDGDVDNHRVTSRTSEIITTTSRAKITIETINDSGSPIPAPRAETKPKESTAATTSDNPRDLISWSDLDNGANTRLSKEKSVTPTPVPRQSTRDSGKSVEEPPLILISPELNSNRTNQPSKPAVITTVDEGKVTETRYRVSESLDEPISDSSSNQSHSGSRVTETERPRTPDQRSSSPRPTPRPRETTTTTTTVTESRYRVPEPLEDTMLEASPPRSSSRTTVTTTRSTDPVFTEYTEDPNSRSTRTVSSSREKISTTTTTETRYDSSSFDASQYDPQSANNKGVLFLKEYVNSRESLKSPNASGSIPDFSDDLERMSYSSSSSYLYSSAPKRSDEGPCTYCGKEIKDCPKIILEHLNIHCHEYCFKCGICNKPMGDLVDSLFIHRDVVHCESCYEKLF
ncbi:zinc finger protein 185 isoform X2 [Engystomops pustulosus]|uniref:zinc finger protein 185 isoform X2 n=1 Tax=Engystomops pustulosus TaxID=76066 RepID=UPI003AFA8E2F